MKNPRLDFRNLFFLCISLFSSEIYPQLGFCQGNYSEPVFIEDFGAGTQDIELPSGSTIYTFANGAEPLEGLYTVSSNTNYFDWFVTEDRTRNDTNGRMLIVNSYIDEDEIYVSQIHGLCENTTYELSSWLLNLTPGSSFCGSDVIPVNIRYEVWDSTYTSILAFGSTGDIYGNSMPSWEQYALVFQTFPGQTSVRLKISTNRPGGCGNDFAIDDIVVKGCRDNISISDSSNNDHVSLCSSHIPYDDTLLVSPDNSVFSTHFYQWQVSLDEGNTWYDIIGETSTSIQLSGIIETSYFRAKVAEQQSNLSISDCVTFSDVYQIIINDAPSPPETECWETATFNPSNCSWMVTGTQPDPPEELECWESLSFNNSSCTWEIEGTQPNPPMDLECWELVIFNESNCLWEIEGTQPVERREEYITLCEESEALLIPVSEIDSPQYHWSSGDMTPSISINTEGSYEVEITDGCFTEIITFIVSEIEDPVIESVISENDLIFINLFRYGDYEYSIDGINYQSSHIFSNIPRGQYTIYVRTIGCDTIIRQEYFHFYIQKFMTPNDDGDHDYFVLNVSQFFTSSQVYIFDRFGKMLFNAVNADVTWDGTFKGEDLPNSDYWYRIILDNQEFIGHFTLKR